MGWEIYPANSKPIFPSFPSFDQYAMSRDMTPIYLPIKVSIVEQLLCNGCVAAHSSLTFGPNLAISVRSVP